MRHKSKQRSLAVQMSERNIDFKETTKEELAQSFAQCTPIHMSNESLTAVRNRFYRFKFTDIKISSDYNQYQVGRPLY